ncbi:ATP-binding protein [Clostridiisalibacter paucivorans]|uniref:ATP-binding protein n=1 Tax=Clostridiisalibacter paucivorans TaxID=408753 RepID=UPI00047B6930|nr:ATP-binding protein [Clostridiisalibacter paucivorans]
MKELSLHILDLVENSYDAGATLVKINILENIDKDILTVDIEDNGKGMDEEFLKRVDDPFMTSRKTRKVGMGISLTKAAALRCEGDFKISSELGKGTEVHFSLKYSHIDRAPLGNMGKTLVSLLNKDKDVDIVYRHQCNNREFKFDTREIKKTLKELSIDNIDVLLWIKTYIEENIKDIHNI